MERASKRAEGIAPQSVTTDKLAAYIDGFELAFDADTKHIRARTLTSEPDRQLIERLHGTLKDCTKIMRSFLRKGTAKTVTDGWRIHYNFFRPHGALGNKTPAKVAGAKSPYKSWLDMVTDKS